MSNKVAFIDTDNFITNDCDIYPLSIAFWMSGNESDFSKAYFETQTYEKEEENVVIETFEQLFNMRKKWNILFII